MNNRTPVPQQPGRWLVHFKDQFGRRYRRQFDTRGAAERFLAANRRKDKTASSCELLSSAGTTN
jgi:hypothetical protein